MKKTNETKRITAKPPADNAPGPAPDRISRSPRPAVPSRVQNLLELRRQRDKGKTYPEEFALNARVLILEGVSGSGKDTFQRYLKEKLKGRAVYNYSEGEVLLSWRHLQIDGIAELRIKLMKLVLHYIRNVLASDKNAVFLFNRFHLSAYVMTVINNPELEQEYKELVELLRALPVHVYILQLDDEEIHARSLHPERSISWRKFRDEIAKRDRFSDILERYRWQQKSMLEAARKQKISYSVLRFPDKRQKPGLSPADHPASTEAAFLNPSRKSV